MRCFSKGCHVGGRGEGEAEGLQAEGQGHEGGGEERQAAAHGDVPEKLIDRRLVANGQ